MWVVYLIFGSLTLCAVFFGFQFQIDINALDTSIIITKLSHYAAAANAITTSVVTADANSNSNSNAALTRNSAIRSCNAHNVQCILLHSPNQLKCRLFDSRDYTKHTHTQPRILCAHVFLARRDWGRKNAHCIGNGIVCVCACVFSYFRFHRFASICHVNTSKNIFHNTHNIVCSHVCAKCALNGHYCSLAFRFSFVLPSSLCKHM